jgi:hypothetical protein
MSDSLLVPLANHHELCYLLQNHATTNAAGCGTGSAHRPDFNGPEIRNGTRWAFAPITSKMDRIVVSGKAQPAGFAGTCEVTVPAASAVPLRN